MDLHKERKIETQINSFCCHHNNTKLFLLSAVPTCYSFIWELVTHFRSFYTNLVDLNMQPDILTATQQNNNFTHRAHQEIDEARLHSEQHWHTIAACRSWGKSLISSTAKLQFLKLFISVILYTSLQFFLLVKGRVKINEAEMMLLSS